MLCNILLQNSFVDLLRAREGSVTRERNQQSSMTQRRIYCSNDWSTAYELKGRQVRETRRWTALRNSWMFSENRRPVVAWTCSWRGVFLINHFDWWLRLFHVHSLTLVGLSLLLLSRNQFSLACTPPPVLRWKLSDDNSILMTHKTITATTSECRWPQFNRPALKRSKIARNDRQHFRRKINPISRLLVGVRSHRWNHLSAARINNAPSRFNIVAFSGERAKLNSHRPF